MSNLPALIQNELSTLRVLSLQDIYNAYFARTPIQGFFITGMEVDAKVDSTVGLCNISLRHINSGIKIDLDRNGKIDVKV